MSVRALTGRWTGYYVQKDQRRGIAADLVQRNEATAEVEQRTPQP